MKNIISILCAAILGMMTASCGFLDESPVTSFSEESVYSTPEALETSLVGCYNAFYGSAMYQGEMGQFLQYASLLVNWKGKRTDAKFTQALDLTMYSVNDNNRKMFSALYSAVYKCNKLIDGLKGSPVEDAFKVEIEAEARLLRGILYFTLVRLYGDVPLVLTPAKTVADASVPRMHYTEVYRQILDDLSYAEANMRDSERQMAVSGTSGRPHKWAATSFKVAVYVQIACLLENKDMQWFDLAKEGRAPDFTVLDNVKDGGIRNENEAWTLALETARSVISDSGYELADKYTDLFRWEAPEDYQLKERIFVLQSTDNGAVGCYLATRTLPVYPGGTLNVSAENKNSVMIRPSRFVFQKWAKTYGGAVADKDERTDVKNVLYVSCPDPRFDATFIHTSYYNQNTKKDVALYPSSGCVRTKNANEPYFKKYLNPRYNVGNSYADFYMLRYADILLMAAEAAASLSSPGDEYWNEALGYIEQIHARARRTVPDGAPQASQPVWKEGKFYTRDQLVKAIMWERVFEMGCEGHEFFDTHRRGAQYIIDEITSPLNSFLELSDQSHGEKSYTNYIYNGGGLPVEPDEVRKGLLIAFPEEEMRYNPAIGNQNDFFVL